MTLRNRQPIPWATVVVTAMIIIGVTTLTYIGRIGGDAAIALYSSICAYVLGASNSSWKTTRRATDFPPNES